jgi:pilus assembly protein CpaB
MRSIMSGRSFIMLALAVSAGLVAAWSARQYLQSRAQQIEDRARSPMVKRIVAARDLPAGARLGDDNVAVREFPASLAPSSSLAPERFTEISGAVLQVSLRAGDPILSALAARAAADPFSSRLGKGRRAMTIPVDVINSVSGLLEPGDLIDLYVSFDYRQKRITAPLLHGVLVLATGANAQPVSDHAGGSRGSYSTVTLDMSPEDAIKLVAARQGGTLTALLRHPTDDGANQKAVRGDLASLLGVTTPPTPGRKTIPVIYGDRGTGGRLPGLSPAAPVSSQAPPLFDLPGVPELVSAWLARGAPGAPDADAPILLEPGRGAIP